MFIHDAIVDHIKCGANEVEAAQVMIEIKKLSEKNKKDLSGFEEKFKVYRLITSQIYQEESLLEAFQTQQTE